MQGNRASRLTIGITAVLATLAGSANVAAQGVTAIVVEDTAALYETWAAEDGKLTVEEWDAAIDDIFGEQDVNLTASDWDEDGNGVISPVEFEEAVTEEEAFETEPF